MLFAHLPHRLAAVLMTAGLASADENQPHWQLTDNAGKRALTVTKAPLDSDLVNRCVRGTSR